MKTIGLACLLCVALTLGGCSSESGLSKTPDAPPSAWPARPLGPGETAQVSAGSTYRESDITGTSVRWDLTPEMQSIGRTPKQRATELHRSVNETTRQIWDDWDMFWLVDEPIRLTQWPIP